MLKKWNGNCLGKCSSIAVGRHNDQGRSHKKKTFNGGGVAYSFRGLVYFHHDREHSGMQTDRMLEK